MDYYQCNKCGSAIKSSRRPNSVGCPKSGLHHWQLLGPVGTHNHQCKKCGTIVEMARSPSSFGCPNSGLHHWYSLGGRSDDGPKPQRKSIDAPSSKSNHTASSQSVGTNTFKSGGGCGAFILLCSIVLVINIYRHFVPLDVNEPASNNGGTLTHHENTNNEQSNLIPKAIPVSEPSSENTNSGRSAVIPKAIPVDEFLPSAPTTSNMLHVFVVFGISQGDSLNVRSSPTMSSVPLIQLRNGQEVQVRGDSVFNGETEWIPINVGETQGWANRAFLMPKQ